eukprot:s1568_g19.t1
MSQPRQWRTSNRDDDDEDEESYEDSSQRETSERPSGTGVTRQVNDRSSVGPPPTYDGDRKPGAWEDYKLRAKLWLRTTTIAETSRGPRMLQQLSGKAFDTMKYMCDDDDWFNNPQNGQLLLEEMGRPDRFGKEEIESLWNALHRLFYSKLRHTDDDLLTFRNRFEEANRKVKKHGVKLPTEALGFIYLRQAQVDDPTLERIVTMTKGDLTLESVIEAMGKLKMRLIQSEDEKRKSHVWMQSTEHEDGRSSVDGISEHPAMLNMEDDEMELLESALRDLEEPGEEEQISEGDAKDILMTLIRQKVNRPVQQFSYKQVQNMKNDLRNGRGFRTPTANQNVGMKRDLQHLKSITKCRNCGMTGHWHRECPQKQKSQPSQPGPSAPSGNASVASREGEASSKAWWSLADSMDRECVATNSQE